MGAAFVVFVEGQNEEDLQARVDAYNVEAIEYCNANVEANWMVQTNVDVDEYLEAQVG